jgi:predicted dienelactone hydrolase
MPPSTLAPAIASERRKFGTIAPIRPSARMAVIAVDLPGVNVRAMMAKNQGARSW